MKIAILGIIPCMLLSTCTVGNLDRHTEPVPPRQASEALAAVAFPSEWNTAETAGGPGFQTFRCEFPVPSVLAYQGQSLFLWCGVQQASGIDDQKDRSFGVLQPVLMFGPDCVENEPSGGRQLGPRNDRTYKQNPYWYYSAQYIYPYPVGAMPKKYRCTTGPLFRATPGETLVSTITYDASVRVMTVSISAADGSQRSSLRVAHPWDDRRRFWDSFMGRDEIVLEGALEIPHPELSPPVPPEILQGWRLQASVRPLSSSPLGANEWRLEPNPENTLAVSCTHEASILGSDCVWRSK